MKKFVAHVGWFAAFAVPAALAAPYQMEVTLQHSGMDEDTTDTETFSLSGIAHFKTVETNDHPLAEAAFLERSSFVSLEYARETADPDQAATVNNNTFAFGLHMQTGERYFFDLDFSNTHGETDDLFQTGLGFGGYIEDNISAQVGYIDATTETDAGDKITGDGFNISGRGVFGVMEGQAVAVEGGFAVIDYDNGVDNQEIISLEGRYYFAKTTYVGLEYGMTSTDDEDIDSYALSAQHFITTEFAVGGSIGKESTDQDNVDDTDTFSVWAKVRY